MWPFGKKPVPTIKCNQIIELEAKINFEEQIERFQLMKLFSKFSNSVGKPVFIRLPDTSSALCTIIREAFIGQQNCYFTVSDSLYNLDTGGGLSEYGCKKESLPNGSKIYFDLHGFWYIRLGKKVSLHVETIIDAMIQDYCVYLDSQIAICQAHIDLEKQMAY